MNGRSYPSAAATAVERAPGAVLAWNVEPTQYSAGTYPEMPPAAAAAVSPVVPAPSAAAAPPDPYGRCWQNQVDPGACFPYFGTLYGSSLPPPSYRMQPGCLSNLGQFWPPTPPPEGCVRYDGSNNLHYCSPLTSVFRHGSESLPQNMLGIPQRLSHYSHLIDMNKDSNLKRLGTCLDSVQRQKMVINSKQTKEVQHRTCSCYECNEKNYSRGTTLHSINKENISSGKVSEQHKYYDDKTKSKVFRKTRDEGSFTPIRTSTAYYPNGSAISYSCSLEQQSAARNASSMQRSNQSDFVIPNTHKMENPVSNSNCIQLDFLKPESSSFPISRCTSNTGMTLTTSKESSHVVPTMTRTSNQTDFEGTSEKMSMPRHKIHVATSGYDPCLPVQTPSSNSQHSAEKSCCFSPPYASSRTMYNNNNYHESSTHSKTPNMLLMYNNGYNASPLKNVYFSYYESENVDMGSGAASNRKSKSNYCKVEKVSSASIPNTPVATPSSNSQNNYLLSSASSANPTTENALHVNPYDCATVPSSSYGCIYQSSGTEQQQQKIKNTGYLTSSKRKSELQNLYEQTKMSSYHIKQEKMEGFDCKFQKSPYHSNDSNIQQAMVPPSNVLNLSTSMRCPKLEHEDQSIVHSPRIPTLLSTTAEAATVKTVPDFKQNRKADVVSNNYYQCCKIPNAISPQMPELECNCTPAVPEDLCPAPHIAPSGGAEMAVLNKMPTTGYEAPIEACQTANLNQSYKLTSRNENMEHTSALQSKV